MSGQRMSATAVLLPCPAGLDARIVCRDGTRIECLGLTSTGAAREKIRWLSRTLDLRIRISREEQARSRRAVDLDAWLARQRRFA